MIKINFEEYLWITYLVRNVAINFHRNLSVTNYIICICLLPIVTKQTLFWTLGKADVRFNFRRLRKRFWPLAKAIIHSLGVRDEDFEKLSLNRLVALFSAKIL